MTIAGMTSMNVNAQSFTFDNDAQGYTATPGEFFVGNGTIGIGIPTGSTSVTFSSNNVINATLNKRYKIVISNFLLTSINILKFKIGAKTVLETQFSTSKTNIILEGEFKSPLWTGIVSNFSLEFSSVSGTPSFEGERITIDEITFSSGPTLGLSDNQNALSTSNLSLSPVPVKDVLTIASSEKVNSFEVYNLVGKKLFSSNTESINVSSLSTGVYVAKIIDQNGVVSTKRFIKE
jgi:hypothetical protein